MTIYVEDYDDITIINLPSKLVYSNAVEVREALFNLIESGKRHLSLDLKNIEMIDSSGLAVLVAVYKRAKRLTGHISLLMPSKNARMLINLTQMDKIFDIYDSKRAAIKPVHQVQPANGVLRKTSAPD